MERWGGGGEKAHHPPSLDGEHGTTCGQGPLDGLVWQRAGHQPIAAQTIRSTQQLGRTSAPTQTTVNQHNAGSTCQGAPRTKLHTNTVHGSVGSRSLGPRNANGPPPCSATRLQCHSLAVPPPYSATHCRATSRARVTSTAASASRNSGPPLARVDTTRASAPGSLSTASTLATSTSTASWIRPLRQARSA